ncbi:MAG: response regulator [Terriglobales bacterium]
MGDSAIGPPSDVKSLPRFGQWCAMALIALGLLVLTGWFFEVDRLKSVLPGFISMKANTALGFALAGAALLLLLRERAKPYAVMLGSVVFLIGALNLVQYVFSVNLHIDQLLILDDSVGPYPGRLAPVTALDFTACGIGIMLIARSRHIILAQVLAVFAAFSAFLAIIGYAFGVPLLYGSVRYTSMALHTGLGCLLLAMGLLAARPHEGIMRVLTSQGPGGWIARRLLPAMLVLPPLLGYVFMQLNGVLGDVRLTVAMIVVTLVVMFLGIIWSLSHFLNQSETQLHYAEAETQRIQKALNHSEELLRQSQKMDAIGQLAAGIAHDFNNLLAVIIGYTDLILFRGEVTDTDRIKLERINEAGETAAALTRQLLAFSRQQLIQPVKLDLNEVISRFDGVLRRLLKEDVQVVVALHPELGLIQADKGQMEQIMLNLAVNASDAMPDGGKLIIETSDVTLDAAFAPEVGLVSGRYVRLTVSDTGAGIPPEVQARIFEPFFTTKPVGKGTGLGLATVFGIVKQSNGGIILQTVVGQGSSFSLYFPTVEPDAKPAVALALPAVAHGGARVLVVEDAEAIAELVRETLEADGFEVLLATNGVEALALCRERKCLIDLVLSDVIMPGMNGREMVAELHKICPQAKIIFMSGYTNDVIVRHGVFHADVGFLQKPFTPKQLVSKVNEVLTVA